MVVGSLANSYIGEQLHIILMFELEPLCRSRSAGLPPVPQERTVRSTRFALSPPGVVGQRYPGIILTSASSYCTTIASNQFQRRNHKTLETLVLYIGN